MKRVVYGEITCCALMSADWFSRGEFEVYLGQPLPNIPMVLLQSIGYNVVV